MKTLSLLTPLGVATLVMVNLAAATNSGLHASEMTEVQCRSDFQELLTEIEDNRKKSIASMSRDLAETTSAQAKSALTEQMERVWEGEERQRGLAATILHDCLRAVALAKKNPG